MVTAVGSCRLLRCGFVWLFVSLFSLWLVVYISGLRGVLLFYIWFGFDLRLCCLFAVVLVLLIFVWVLLLVFGCYSCAWVLVVLAFWGDVFASVVVELGLWCVCLIWCDVGFWVFNLCLCIVICGYCLLIVLVRCCYALIVVSLLCFNYLFMLCCYCLSL